MTRASERAGDVRPPASEVESRHDDKETAPVEPVHAGPRADDGEVTAVLCVGDSPQHWTASIASLVEAGAKTIALTSAHGRDAFGPTPPGVEVVVAGLGDVIARELRTRAKALFVATAPVVVSTGAFDVALAGMGDDIRVASASFFSNNGNYLSFPQRNQPSGLTVNGHNEETLTRALRAVHRGNDLVPIPVPAGGGVLYSASVLRAVGLPVGSVSPEVAMLDVAMRATGRGFRHVLDATSYIVRPLVPGRHGDALNDPDSREWLHSRHPSFPALYDWARDASAGPLADAIALRRAAVFGMSVVIDGGCLGPYEMGTQSSILGQIGALADHPGIRQIVVGTPGGRVPGYASRVLSHPKVIVCPEDGSAFPGAGDADIVHRPFQPSGPLPFEHWRRIARRTVLSIQDLIAYENGNYFDTVDDWMRYRTAMVDSSGQADMILAISHDAAVSVETAALPLGPNGVVVVECGTDHLRRTAEVPVPPVELVETDTVADPFILILGASYAHKNRDVAIAAWQELRRRGNPLRLVLAGAVVPFGSTRNEEAAVGLAGEWPTTLADVTSAERDWLLEHAALVLYPSSAEGFGLVPFEAAVFDTPALFVGFGPLAETLPDVPVAAVEWTPDALADTIGILMEDPDLGRAQVAAVKKHSAELTWKRCADGLVDAYLTALATPSVHSHH